LSLLSFTESGIYCQKGDFYIDPWRPVDRAIITHGHADHARPGHKYYLCHDDAYPILQYRLGPSNNIETLSYGKTQTINGVKVSLHPAGHIIGSAQVRVEYQGEIWVISGDYKIHDDGLTTPFEPVRCHAFITECTFGLPVYRWPSQNSEIQRVREWWQANQAEGKGSLLIAYSLGKAQRMLQAVGNDLGPVFTHGSVANINHQFRDAGFNLPQAPKLDQSTPKKDLKKALFLAPSSVIGTGWTKRFEPYSIAMASGWMMLRGTKRRRSVDRGFVISDHVDWLELNEAVKATGAETIYTTHGYTDVSARWFREQGYEAYEVTTQFEGETDEPEGDENG